MLLLHNLTDKSVTVDIGKLDGITGTPREIFADGAYDAPTKRLSGLALRGSGYRWLKLSPR